MKFSSIIFDWDGTLGMTLHLWLDAYRGELLNLGYTFSDEIIIQDFFYEHDRAAIKYPSIDFDSFVKNVHERMVGHVSSMKTYPDALYALEKLQDNDIKLALVSSSPRRLVKEALKYTGLDKFFSLIVAGDDIMKHKPDPEAFNEIIEIAKLNPKDVLILGDSHNDIIAAKAAGISSCLFLPPENKIFYDFSKLKETNPTYCAENLKDFTGIVVNPKPVVN